jgi:putative membrane protein
MHMTLLGALLALATRPLYHERTEAALADQHLGGALMLASGGAVYLVAALLLAATLLKQQDLARRYARTAGARS